MLLLLIIKVFIVLRKKSMLLFSFFYIFLFIQLKSMDEEIHERHDQLNASECFQFINKKENNKLVLFAIENKTIEIEKKKKLCKNVINALQDLFLNENNNPTETDNFIKIVNKGKDIEKKKL